MSRPNFLALTCALMMLFASAAAQVSLPPVNLGLTSFQDAIAFPGWLVEEIPNFDHASQWKDAQGNELAGVNGLNSASALTHVAYISKGLSMLTPTMSSQDMNTRRN